MKYEVAVIIPKNREILEKKFTEAMIDICIDTLSKDEIELLIEKLSEKLEGQ